MLSVLNPFSEPDGWARFYADMRFAFGANLMLGAEILENPLRMGAGKLYCSVKNNAPKRSYGENAGYKRRRLFAR